jgi:hypothetical protein
MFVSTEFRQFLSNSSQISEIRFHLGLFYTITYIHLILVWCQSNTILQFSRVFLDEARGTQPIRNFHNCVETEFRVTNTSVELNCYCSSSVAPSRLTLVELSLPLGSLTVPVSHLQQIQQSHCSTNFTAHAALAENSRLTQISQSQNQSYGATEGQSASLSRYQVYEAHNQMSLLSFVGCLI